MSATVSWASSGLGTKTGTTNQLCLDDLNTLITSKSGDATFKWEVAGSSTGATPRYTLLRRKDGSAGRIAIIIWDSAPAANNAAILDTTPTSNAVQFAYFPAGTGTTLSNLTAASGTICGNDTGAIKCCSPGTVGTVYAALIQWFYFDHAEGMVFCLENPAAVLTYSAGAGAHVVDGADVAYDVVFATNGANPWNSFGSVTVPPLPWQATFLNAGLSTTGVIRTNYGSSNRNYFHAFAASGVWANVAVSSTDILTDTTLNKAWFLSPQLLGTTKGEGPILKWRQIAYGPGTVGAFTVYNTTGPVVAARQASAATAGTNGAPWMCNFKT